MSESSPDRDGEGDRWHTRSAEELYGALETGQDGLSRESVSPGSN